MISGGRENKRIQPSAGTHAQVATLDPASPPSELRAGSLFADPSIDQPRLPGRALGRPQWAERIAAAWRSSLSGILEAGRLLAEAKDGQMIEQATEIRLRAERRAGQLLKQMADSGERDRGHGGDRKSQSHDATVKLDDLGISKTQSSRWQKLGEMEEDAFEARTATAKKQAVASVEMTAAERAVEKK
jgi:hypothetical protein